MVDHHIDRQIAKQSRMLHDLVGARVELDVPAQLRNHVRAGPDSIGVDAFVRYDVDPDAAHAAFIKPTEICDARGPVDDGDSGCAIRAEALHGSEHRRVVGAIAAALHDDHAIDAEPTGDVAIGHHSRLLRSIGWVVRQREAIIGAEDMEMRVENAGGRRRIDAPRCRHIHLCRPYAHA